MFATLRVLAGWRGRFELVGSTLRSTVAPRAGSAALPARRLRIKGLGEVWVRPDTTDIWLIWGHVLGGLHRPLEPIAGRDLQRICEFGTNIGLGLADLATRYPRADLVGVEPDPTNAELARRNLAPFASRCELVEAAVWDTSGEVALEGTRPGLIVAKPCNQAAPEAPRIRAATPQELLARHMPDGEIDFLHLDTVGSELRFLRPGAEWMRRVRSVKVQLYPGHELTPDRCRDVFSELGFEAITAMTEYGPFGFGWRPGGWAA